MRKEIEEMIRDAKQVIVEAQEEKIRCLENRKKPDILLDRTGRANTNPKEDEIIIANCNHIIDLAVVRIKTLEDVLALLGDSN